MNPSSVGSALSRRTFLRGAGVALALPLLDSMLPAGKAAAPVVGPRRMVAIETNMGILPQFFFPDRPGRDFALTPYLQKLAELRNHFTVFSGVSHPGVTGGTPPRSASSPAPPTRSGAASATGSPSTSSPPSASAAKPASPRSCWP